MGFEEDGVISRTKIPGCAKIAAKALSRWKSRGRRDNPVTGRPALFRSTRIPYSLDSCLYPRNSCATPKVTQGTNIIWIKTSGGEGHEPQGRES